AVMTARRADGQALLGYHRRRSTALVDIEECPVLRDEIVAKLPALRAIADLLPAPDARFTVLHTPAGLDVAVETAQTGRGVAARTGRDAVAALGRIAAQHGLARLTVGPETVIQRARPTLRMGEVDVAVPPGAFVQAVQ